MALKTINDTTLTNIANAIREKNGTSTQYTPVEMPEAIRGIQSGGSGGSGGSVDNELYKKLIDRTIAGEVTIPQGLTEIGPYAFSECSEITKVNIPQGVTIIGKYAFQHISITSTLEVVLPNGLVKIGDSAFNQSGVKNITIPDTVTYIGYGAFESTKIKVFKTPKNMEGLLSRVVGSTPLERLEIGENTTRIYGYILGYVADNYLSDNCKIIFKGTPTKLDAKAFNANNKNIQIYVPWAEGEVAGAPWGAAKATIHYNHTGEVA